MLYEPPGDSVRESMTRLVAKHHPDLAEVVDRIAIIFREKASKSGGQLVLGKAAKASEREALLGRKGWVFVIELAGDQWGNLNDRQRMALLDHCLCACKVSYTDDGRKFSIRKPDFWFFQGEIERWGIWQTLEKGEDEKAATVIEKLLIDDENVAAVDDFLETEKSDDIWDRVFRMYSRNSLGSADLQEIFDLTEEEVESKLEALLSEDDE